MEIKFDFLGTTSTILDLIKTGVEVSQSLSHEAQKNYRISKILKKLNLAPIETADNVEIVYTYALVKYGVFKPKPILELLRKPEIKDYFWGAYKNNTPLVFLQEVKNFISQDTELTKKLYKCIGDLSIELELFGEAFIYYAKRVTSEQNRFTLEDGSYPDWDLDNIPREFRALINEKTRLFCGREFIFKAFEDDFLKKYDKGYFVLVADAGMGKSTVASKYVSEKKSVCYFNRFTDKNKTSEKFLQSLREQLRKRYLLTDFDDSNLYNLLQEVSDKLPEGDKLVIVVDALDEVDHNGNGNLLDLPQTLPKGVYFFMTRRPYDPDEKYLKTSTETFNYEIDISSRSEEVKLKEYNQDDIRKYVRHFINLDESELKKWITELPNEKNDNTKLQQEVVTINEWLKKQDNSITEIELENILVKKSENNFMYLRYVLPSIAIGKYNDLCLEGLPDGLQDYYVTHWKRMQMDQDNNDTNVKILFILVVIGESVSSEFIGDILDMDIFEVENILIKWVEYIVPKKVEQDEEEKTYYTIYHRSFLDFLKKRPKLDAKKNKRRFKEVNKQIFYYLNR